MESLGVPTRDGDASRARPAQDLAASSPTNYHLFRGTPSRRVARPRAARAVRRARASSTPTRRDRIYDQIDERLTSPEFRPRALFERFNIEVLATTDAATDALAAPSRDPRVGLERPRRADLPPRRALPHRDAGVARRARARSARCAAQRSADFASFIAARSSSGERIFRVARRDGDRPRRRRAVHGAPRRPTTAEALFARRCAATPTPPISGASRRTC